MKKKLSDKKKVVAYVLNQDPDFDFSQKKIAKLMDVSQGTISLAIREVKFRIEIDGLKKELKKARKLIADWGIEPINEKTPILIG